MTEKEVSEMELEVMSNVELDSNIQKEWLKERFAEAKRSEQQLMNAFRLHKYVRDENAMKATKDQIKKMRDAIEFLEIELKEFKKESS